MKGKGYLILSVLMLISATSFAKDHYSKEVGNV